MGEVKWGVQMKAKSAAGEIVTIETYDHQISFPGPLKERLGESMDVFEPRFMFFLLTRFHPRSMSYKALILAFTTQQFQRKGSNTRRKGEVSISG